MLQAGQPLPGTRPEKQWSAPSPLLVSSACSCGRLATALACKSPGCFLTKNDPCSTQKENILGDKTVSRTNARAAALPEGQRGAGSLAGLLQGPCHQLTPGLPTPVLQRTLPLVRAVTSGLGTLSQRHHQAWAQANMADSPEHRHTPGGSWKRPTTLFSGVLKKAAAMELYSPSAQKSCRVGGTVQQVESSCLGSTGHTHGSREVGRRARPGVVRLP